MKKGIGDKVLGWFVVEEDAEASAGVKASADADADADASADAKANANANEEAGRRTSVAAARPRASAVPVVGGLREASGFGAVYRAAGVEDTERERLTKVLSLLESLPEDARIDVKRAIVAASLEAFGVSIDRILVTSEGALAALDGHVAAGQGRTKEVIARAESRIAALTSEIEEQRRLVDAQLAAQQDLARAVAAEKSRLRGVIEFFDHGHAERPDVPRLVRLK
jgi:hypothetical protein